MVRFVSRRSQSTPGVGDLPTVVTRGEKLVSGLSHSSLRQLNIGNWLGRKIIKSVSMAYSLNWTPLGRDLDPNVMAWRRHGGLPLRQTPPCPDILVTAIPCWLCAAYSPPPCLAPPRGTWMGVVGLSAPRDRSKASSVNHRIRELLSGLSRDLFDRLPPSSLFSASKCGKSRRQRPAHHAADVRVARRQFRCI